MGRDMRNFAWRATLALAGAAALAAAPARAELINAADPEKIRTIVESLGSPATLRAEPNADPYIESNLDGMPSLVIFMNCTDVHDCLPATRQSVREGKGGAAPG